MTGPLLNDLDFQAMRRFLDEQAGLVFDESRRASLSAIVAERMTHAGSNSVADYLAQLTQVGAVADRQQLIDDVTIQETHFHRNRPQIEALRRQILPALLRAAAAQQRTLTIWSAGCSTGEEPYTIAMLALEFIQAQGLDIDLRILGTDVSAQALEVARAGQYSGRTVELAETSAVQRWLRPIGGGRYEVADAPRSYIDFRLHNLVTEPAPFAMGEVDLVVCRNVTIYFARETTRALMKRFFHALAPGGWLLLGHSETLWQISDDFDLVPVGDAFAYRRPAQSKSNRPPGGPPQPAQPRTPGSAGDRSRGWSGVAAGRPGPQPSSSAAGATAGSGCESGVSHGAPGSDAAAVADVARGASDAGEVVPSGNDRVAAMFPTAVRLGRLLAKPRSGEQASTLRSDGKVLVAQAKDMMAMGRYEESARVAQVAIKVAPLDAEAYLVLGQARCTLGRDSEAVEPLRKAVYLEPSWGHAHFLLGGALARTGDQAGAARSFQAAARSLPQVSGEALVSVLNGRPVAELVALCERLAEDANELAVPGT